MCLKSDYHKFLEYLIKTDQHRMCRILSEDGVVVQTVQKTWTSAKRVYCT